MGLTALSGFVREFRRRVSLTILVQDKAVTSSPPVTPVPQERVGCVFTGFMKKEKALPVGIIMSKRCTGFVTTNNTEIGAVAGVLFAAHNTRHHRPLSEGEPMSEEKYRFTFG
jgi:hypothetical protein